MFTEGTYDLAHNNCNSFSAAMLQYLCDWQLGIPKCFIMREQFGKKCCRRTLQLFPVVTSSCRVRCVARDNVAFANSRSIITSFQELFSELGLLGASFFGWVVVCVCPTL